MPIVSHIVCDGCQNIKKETNHWYTIQRENKRHCIEPLALPADWAIKTLHDSAIEYFCGRSCALEALTKWMESLSRQQPEREC